MFFRCRSNSTAKPYGNDTLHPKTSAKPTTTTPPTPKPILPVQTGVKAQEEEQSSGMTIFFSLLVIGWWFCSFNFIVFISLSLQKQCHKEICTVGFLSQILPGPVC